MELWIDVWLKEQRTERVKMKGKVFSAALTWFYIETWAEWNTFSLKSVSATNNRILKYTQIIDRKPILQYFLGEYQGKKGKSQVLKEKRERAYTYSAIFAGLQEENLLDRYIE